MSNIRSILAWVALAAALAFISAGAMAAPRPAPDLSGLWETTLEVTFTRALERTESSGLPRGWRVLNGYTTVGNAPPPLRPGIFEIIRTRQEEEAQGRIVDEGTGKCLPPNNFDMMTWHDPIDIMQRPDSLVLLSEKERAIPRRIYIEAQHSKDLKPSPNGESVAHWEGDTLVVDTIGIDPHGYLFYRDYVPHSAELHVTERIRLDERTGRLIVNWTFDDPNVFTKPWELRSEYERATKVTELFENICDVNARR